MEKKQQILLSRYGKENIENVNQWHRSSQSNCSEAIHMPGTQNMQMSVLDVATSSL